MAKSRFFTVLVTGLILAVVFGGGAAVAAKMITGKQIKNNTVTTKDIKNNNVSTKDLKNNNVSTKDVKDGTIASGDIKNGTVASGDLANGSVTENKIAPGAIAFPNSLWGTILRNQSGAAESGFQVGPEGQPMGDGSLRLFVAGPPDLAAFGNSFDFARFQLEDVTDVSYATHNADAVPLVRPSLRVEIDPHLVDDATLGGAREFTTLVHQPPAGATGWETHDAALADDAWYLTGDEGSSTGCTQDTPCTYTEVLSVLTASGDPDTALPEISTGVYFGLGTGVSAPTETAVDALVVNGFEFDFEPMGVFQRPATP